MEIFSCDLRFLKDFVIIFGKISIFNLVSIRYSLEFFFYGRCCVFFIWNLVYKKKEVYFFLFWFWFKENKFVLGFFGLRIFV